MFLRSALLGIILFSILWTETTLAGSSFLSPEYKKLQVERFRKMLSRDYSLLQALKTNILYSIQRSFYKIYFLEEEGLIPENFFNKLLALYSCYENTYLISFTKN